jgi:alcohol dehydrogenase class IV
MRTPLPSVLRTGSAGTFDVSLPDTVLFGYGCRNQIPDLVAEYGSKPLFVVGKRSVKASGMLDELIETARDEGLDVVTFSGVEAEPMVETVDRAREMLAEEDCDLVVAVGGGSVIDVGKAAAALIDSDHPTAAHLAGESLPEDGMAVIAVPTTAGTGAEVTPNAVLRDLSAEKKASIRGDNLLPVAAVVDPQLTMSAPAEVTAHSGLDAFTQALEAFTSAGANPFTDALAADAVFRIGVWLPIAFRDPRSWPGRENVALGSLFAGIALASARLGLVHGLAHPIGLLHDIPHGLACALLLPHVVEFNLEAAEEKYTFCAHILQAGDSAEHLLGAVRKLLEMLRVTDTLADLGLRPEDFDKIIPPAMASGSTKHNPRDVTEEDLRALLEKIAAGARQ